MRANIADFCDPFWTVINFCFEFDIEIVFVGGGRVGGGSGGGSSTTSYLILPNVFSRDSFEYIIPAEGKPIKRSEEKRA